jgi:hypothetical protein
MPTTTITLPDATADQLLAFLKDLASGGPGYLGRSGVDTAAELRDAIVAAGVRTGR